MPRSPAPLSSYSTMASSSHRSPPKPHWRASIRRPSLNYNSAPMTTPSSSSRTTMKPTTVYNHIVHQL